MENFISKVKSLRDDALVVSLQKKIEKDDKKRKNREELTRKLLVKVDKVFLSKIRKEILESASNGGSSLSHYIKWEYEYGSSEVVEKILYTLLDEGFDCTYKWHCGYGFFGNFKRELVFAIRWH